MAVRNRGAVGGGRAQRSRAPRGGGGDRAERGHGGVGGVGGVGWGGARVYGASGQRRRSPPSGQQSSVRSAEVVLELVGVGVAAEFGEGLGFDLADAFAGYAERSADLLEGVRLAVGEAVAQLHDAFLALA